MLEVIVIFFNRIIKFFYFIIFTNNSEIKNITLIKIFTAVFQKEIYNDSYWCEIMPITASKANEILQLKETYNFDNYNKKGCGKYFSL